MHDDLSRRKSEHLELAMRPEVEPEETDALFRCVHLVHCALPELRLADIDLSTRLCGVTLRAPLMIVGMTGGTDRAQAINRDLAKLAEEEGVAFGVGSMRVLLTQPELLPTFAVAPARPPLLFANLGAQQLVQSPDAPERLMQMLGADGICIHLNPAQELVQEAGDRDFTGCLDALGKLAQRLGPRLIVKETGCGISPSVARALHARGVRTLDVSGAGGTSWTRVEELRAATPRAKALGALLSGWGIPTAACIEAAARAGMEVVASGGVRSGLDAARALALGARAVGVGLPLLRAHQRGGLAAARDELQALLQALRAACLLVGAKDLAGLSAAPRVIEEPLSTWRAQLERSAP